MHRLLVSCLLFIVAVKGFAQSNPLFDPSKIEINPIKQNTDESEFGPYVNGNSFYYTSSQERKVGVISMETSSQHQMLDLYSGTIQSPLNITQSKPLNSAINTPLNQGGCFFDKATSKLYYSTDIPCENNPKKFKLAIYSAVLQNDVFLEPVPELVLADTFSAAHPYVYNNKLYFSSNMEGGKGKTDIYFAEKLNETWGNYKNCDFINSEENEFFPFVINENEIYFSSNRPGGLGKLDLYKYTSTGKSTEIQNAGSPMNSTEDDFSIYVDSLQESGYFSSNREDGQDDIYFYRQTWPTFTNCKDNIPEDYCYNLSEESTLDTKEAKGFYYEWLLGDGTKQKGLSVRHCFPGPGKYLINLNIIDSLTKTVFMSQATFDLKVDSIIQLKINCLDTVPVHKNFLVNTDWTYLPDNKIEGYYFETEKKRLREKEFLHSFSKPGVYKITLGAVTINTRTKKKELLCTTKNIVCVEQNQWAAIEQRKFKDELIKYTYKAFKSDSVLVMSLLTDEDIALYNKKGLNGQKLGKEIKSLLAAKAGKKELDQAVPGPKNRLAYSLATADTLLLLKEQESVTFKVHFGTSKTRKDTSLLHEKGLIGVAENIINNEYHYTYGNENKLNAIEKYYQRSLKAGIKNPVVIGYKNDKIIFDQSKNIHPATFEEAQLNAIRDSVIASSPQTFIENKNSEPASINSVSEIPDKQSNNSISGKSSPETKEKENTITNNEKQKNKEPLIDPNENLNISNEKEFNSLTNVQKKMEYYLQKYGDISIKDLEFRVQVGAFRKRKSYHFPKLAGLGEIKNEEHADGINRMTIGGSFNKLSEAFNFTKKVVNAGQEDAFVSVYYKGKRVYIENLEKKGLFLGKEIPAEQVEGNIKAETTIYETANDKAVSHSGEFEARTNIQKKIVMYTEKYGHISADGLEFKVQIAVFKYRKNYDFPRLQNLGEIHVESLNGGVVRVTIGGSFKTLGEAFELNKKVVIAGQSDAFVSVFYKGKRIYIENLEHKGIFVVNKN